MTRRLPRISRALTVLAAALGTLGIVARITGHPLLAGPFGGVPMRLDAALLSLLAAGALAAVIDEQVGLRLRTTSRALALVVTVLALATLIEYSFSVDLGLDRLFGPAPAGGPPAGRMAPLTALAFTSLGGALLLIDRRMRGGQRLSEWLALVTFLIAFLATTDFAYGHEMDRPDSLYQQLALYTAVALGALSLAVIFARPAAGFIGVFSDEGAGGALARRLLPAILVIPPIAGWLRLRAEQAGSFDTAFGTALMVTSTVLLLATALLWKAASVNAVDRHRQELAESNARTADQLRRANDLLDAIIEHLPQMVFMKDAERLTFVRFNRAGEQLLGLSRESMLGKTDFDFFPPDQAEHFQAKDRETLASGGIVDLEEPIDSPAGRRWLHTKKVGLRGPDGRPIFLLGISEDITQRREKDEALQKWAHVFEHAHWGIALASADGKTLEQVNPAFAEMHGYHPDELRGHPALDLVAPEDHQNTLLHMARAEHAGEETFQVMRLRKDGARFPALVNVSAVKGDDGRVQFRAASVQDISAIRHTEEELRRSKNAAEATSRELESFSYSVSHDLRSPLRTIDGFSQALLEDHGHLLDEGARQHLDRVRAAAQRMAELIDDLLELSRVTRAELHRRTVDLTAVARDVAAGLARDAPDRQVRFIIAEGMRVEGDPRLIRVLFENLLGNAWKFTAHQPTATIEVGRGPDGHLFVRDDGAGFDMAYADKLFGAFQRLHRESEFEGTGIGLATVHRIVLRHGGRIWAEGKVGGGATFHFTLAPA
jgi:PAS domain S-box-containing protein